MIEMSFMELALLCWAVLATAYAFKFKEDAHRAGFLVHKLISDEKVRTEMVEGYEKFKREREA